MSINKPTLIMGWGECLYEIGKIGENEKLSTTLQDVGVTKDKSTTLESSNGDTLEYKGSGGKVYAKEETEGKMIIKTRIAEPSEELMKMLLGAETSNVEGSPEEQIFRTTVVEGDYSVKITPKNRGAWGIIARKTHITAKQGYGEEEGNFVDLEQEIIFCADGELYRRFKKA